MSELDIRLECLFACPRHPHDQGLSDLLSVEGKGDLILIHTPHLTEASEHLDGGVFLIAQQMIQEGASGVPVAADGDPLVETVCIPGNYIVRLVGKTAGLGDKTHGARSVKLRLYDILQGSPGVTDLEGACPDTSHRGRSDDHLPQLVGPCDQFLRLAFRDTLGDQNNCPDLFQIKSLLGGLGGGTEGCETDQDIRLSVPAGGCSQGCVDGDQDLHGTEKELLQIFTPRRINDGSHRGRFSPHGVVKVQHPLYGIGLYVIDERLGFPVEEFVLYDF